MSILISLSKKTEKILKRAKKTQIIEEDNIQSNNTINNDYFCCPKCKERILIKLNPENFSLSYNCENNHKESNIDYNNFYNKRYIYKNSNIFCQQCNKEKLNNIKKIKCSICNKTLCTNCIIKHKAQTKHNNYEIINDSFKKCLIHNIDISMFCKTCQKNICIFCLKDKEENIHINHEIINFSDIIPDINEINDNKNKLKEKVKKNNDIIIKLKKWKEEICSLIDELIDKLINENKINKMLIENFNWKYLDYINYTNYKMSLNNLEIINEGIEKFYKSKMFIEQTNCIIDYLFGKNNINTIKNENKNGQNLNDNNKDRIIINKYEKNIIDIFKNNKSLLYHDDSIYSYDLKNNKIYNEFAHNGIVKNKNENENNQTIYENMTNLIINITQKIGNCNIIIYKTENNFNLDKIINFFSDNENIKFNKLQISNNYNFNFIKKTKINIKNNINTNNNDKELNEISSDNLLSFKEDKTLINSNKNITNSLFNNNISNIYNINTNSNIFSNLFSNKNIEENKNNNNDSKEEEEEVEQIEDEEEEEEEEEEEDDGNTEYVYISRTGSKYHGSPQCGRMRTSTCVSLKEAESQGLEPCMRCYG